MLLWSLLLILSLLCAQGVTLHIHNLGHEHTELHSLTPDINETNDHPYLSRAHFSHDASHEAYHDEVISEIDISPDGLLKKMANNLIVIALFIFLFTLARLVSSAHFVRPFRKKKLIIQEHYVLSPPLRAPPQH